MSSKITHAKHVSDAPVEAPRLSLKNRALAGLTTGCLLLAMAPASAMAAPIDQADPQQGGNPPAMQQAPEGGQQAPNGQMPSGQAPSGEAPDGQAPSGGWQMPNGQLPDGQGQNGGPQPNSEFDDQVREIISTLYGIETALPNVGGETPGAPSGKPGEAGEIPEIPEGQFNIQAVIDSVRDVLRDMGAKSLESADFDDEEFRAQLTDAVQTATEQRQAMFEKGEPSGTTPQPGDEPPAGLSHDTVTPDDLPSSDGNGAIVGQQPTAELLQKLVDFVAGILS